MQINELKDFVINRFITESEYSIVTYHPTTKTRDAFLNSIKEKFRTEIREEAKPTILKNNLHEFIIGERDHRRKHKVGITAFVFENNVISGGMLSQGCSYRPDVICFIDCHKSKGFDDLLASMIPCLIPDGMLIFATENNA